jgi:hypothetical protein
LVKTRSNQKQKPYCSPFGCSCQQLIKVVPPYFTSSEAG